jgi:hypothetical protein
MSESDGIFEGWAILELMGHRKLAGYVSEVEVAGRGMLRLDVPRAAAESDSWRATQFYSPQALYCLTPTDEATARALASRNQPEPVTRWELPAAVPPVDEPEAVEEDPLAGQPF